MAKKKKTKANKQKDPFIVKLRRRQRALERGDARGAKPVAKKKKKRKKKDD